MRVHAVEADGTIFPLNVYADRSIAEAGAPIPAAQRRGRFGRRRSGSAEAAAQAAARPSVPERPMTPPPAAPAQPPTAMPEPVAPHPTWAPPVASAGSAHPVQALSTPTKRAPGGGVPAPRDEQQQVLDLIREAIGAGDGARALAMAAELDTTATAADPAERLAAREVHGYVALATGRPALAVRLYAEAVTFGDHLEEPGEWRMRMAANAHFCWLRVADPVAADAVGELVMNAYAAGGAADSPAARAARRHMARTKVCA